MRLARVVLVPIFATAVSQAQTPPHAAPTGIIDGFVSDTALAPLSDATVDILASNLRVTTGINGRFRMLAVPAGQYTLLVRRLGFEATTAKITVAAAETLRVSFALEPAVRSLEPVLVAARASSWRLAEFEEHRKLGIGQFITGTEIDKQNPVYTSDMFRRFLGIQVSASGNSAKSARGTGKGCPIIALVDGMTREANLLQLPPPRDIVGIEFYAGPSEIPLQYKTTDNGGCGLLVVWTRVGP